MAREGAIVSIYSLMTTVRPYRTGATCRGAKAMAARARLSAGGRLQPVEEVRRPLRVASG
jgi:hypothetical protein